MPTYSVVSRAQAGVRFTKPDPLIVTNWPTPFGQLDIVFRTRLAMLPGISRRVEMGLEAEATGVAPSLDEALQHFSRQAQSICPVLSFVGNSTIEDMIPHVGYDISPGLTERDYFQQFIEEESLLYVTRRTLSSELVVRILHALHGHNEVERMQRALGQYHQALRYWEPGQEILALVHLWIGIEALTKVVLRRVLSSGSIDDRALAAQWQIEIKQLDGEVRKRLILNGDAEAYKKAKDASDGFEHGYMPFADVHTHADPVRVRVAAYLRQAIIDELQLDMADRTALLSDPYSSPGHLRFGKYLRGKLLGAGETLAAPGEAYPFLEWRTENLEVPSASSDIDISVKDTMTWRFADGISFRQENMELWGGQESAIKRGSP